MPTNPILDELSGLSPGAQQALMGAHSATTLAPHPPPVDPGLQAPSKIQKPAQIGAPPPAPTATMSGPPPSMGAPSMPNVEAPRGTLQGDQNERGRLEATGPGITQIHSKIENSQFGQNHPTLGKIAGYGAEIPLRVLEAAGSMLGPVRSAEQLLPGTQAHHAMEMRNLNSNIGNESKENLQGAQAGEANARTNALENPADKYTALPTDTGYAAFDTRKGTANTLTDQAGQPLSPVDKTKTSAPHFETLQDGSVLALHTDAQGHTTPEIVYKGDPKIQTDLTTQEINGVQHTVVLNKQTGELIKDVGPTGFKAPNIHIDANHEFAENERGRGLLDKAETAYRTAHQGAQGIRAAVDDAMQGGKMSARMLPLEGALEITTANGVHRINRTEVDQYAGGGSLYDRLVGALKGGGTGIPFTNEIMQDMKHLADLQEKGAYENYKGAYDSATKRYHLQDEKPLPEPSGGQGGSGKSVSLQEAKGLPQFKGKSDAEITAAIKAAGHEVLP